MKTFFTKQTLRLSTALLCCLLTVGLANAQPAPAGGAPCDNTIADGQFPIGTVTVDAPPTVTTISTNLYAGSEFSVVNGLSVGRSYEFTHANGSYITVRVGAADGPVLGSGFSPLTVIATGTDDVYVHWTVDAACNTDATGSFLATVQDVTPPCDMSGEDGQWPSGTVALLGEGVYTQISTVNYAGSEYSVVSGFIGGNNYEIVHGNNSYVTVREGAVDGPVVAAGYTPLTFTAVGTSDLYLHWTVDDLCAVLGTGGGLFETGITDMGVPPCNNSASGQWPGAAVSVDATGLLTQITDDAADGNEYSVVTDILNFHDYEITHDGGAYITVTSGAVDGPLVGRGFSPLTVTASGTDDFYIHWTLDAACALSDFVNLTSTTTIQDLSAPPCVSALVNFTYCYDSNETTEFLIEPNNPGDLPSFVVNAGSYESCCDVFTVYDGTTTADPVLFTGAGDLTGTMVASTSGNLLIVITSDGSVSCASGSETSLDIDVQCGFVVIEGCTDPTALNYDPSANLDDLSCILPNCPEAPLNFIHCYDSNADDQFLYTPAAPGVMPQIFINSGSLESCCDVLTIYDGTSTADPVLYTGAGDVSGVYVESTSGFLLMQITSDGSVSCFSGSQTALDWNVYCGVPCENPDAGSLTADASPVCMSGGSATISATPNGDQVVPAGNVAFGILADNAGNILDGGAFSFNVPAAGDYYIHTVVGSLADQAIYATASTILDLHLLTIPGGGTLCGSVDQVGVLITVNEEPTATMSGGGLSCDGATVDVEIAFTGTGPWSVNYTDPVGVVDLNGVTDNPLVISTSDAGAFSINTTSDANCPGTVSGSATVTAGTTPVADFTSTPTGLDVDFVDASTGVPTGWFWDFGDGNTSTMQNPTHTYAAAGDYPVCLTVTNTCGTDSACDATVTVTTPGPANDLCTNAEVIACGGTATGSTATATNTDEPDCVPGAGVWYVWSGDGSFVTFSTDNAGTDYDTRIGYTDACGNACLGFDEDGGVDFVNGWTSVLSFASVPGTDYYIYVGGYQGTEVGNFELTVTCVAPPANDVACGAVALTNDGVANGPYDHSNYSAAAWEEAAIPSVLCAEQGGWCVDTDVENSGWYTFVAPASGNVTVSAAGSTFDTQVAVFSGATCQDIESGTGVLVGANDDDPAGGLQSLVILCDLTPGDTYYVLLDGYGGAEGDATLTVTETTVDAGFTYVATGLSVDFTDASTTSSTIVSWAWDFGDGETSTDMSPTHVYAADGPYTVCLTVTDENGCTSEYCEAIQVTDPVTSIVEALDNGMEVYPNPSNGQFIITVRGVEADAQIVVMDVAGRQVYNEGVTLNNSFRKEMTLDVAKGTYLLQIATVEGLVTRKIQVH